MNLLEERYQFYHRQQKVHESVEDFATEIKRLAATCLFENVEHSIVRDRVLFGLKNRKLLLRIVQFGGDPTINEVINLYTELTNGSPKQEKLPRNERRSKRNVNKSAAVAVKDEEWEATSDGQNGFDDFHGDFEEITVKNDPELDIDNIDVYSKLEVVLTDIRDTLQQANKYDTCGRSETSPDSLENPPDVEKTAATNSVHSKLKPATKHAQLDVFASPSSLKHNKTKTKPNNKDIKICPICNAKFKWQTKYDYHVQNHRKCPVCAKDFFSQYYLDKHMFVHTNEKPINCPKCGRGFKNDVHMKKHLERTHATFDNIECKICGKVCRREWLLKLHMEGQHPETIPDSVGREYECYVCRKPFKSELTLRTHLYTHVRKRNVLCPQCGMSFYSESRLRMHLMRDDHNADGENVKPFKCDYCGRRFSQLSRLTMHRHVHTGEKPFSCNLCGKRFGHLSNLGQHKLTHMDEKRHHCQFCDHKCRSAGNLRKHMKVHTGR